MSEKKYEYRVMGDGSSPPMAWDERPYTDLRTARAVLRDLRRDEQAQYEADSEEYPDEQITMERFWLERRTVGYWEEVSDE